MASRLNPYIHFAGDARAALDFYRDVFGGTLHVTTYGEFGTDDTPDAAKIMHGQLETDNGFTLMAGDLPPGTELTRGNGITISLSGDDETELRGYWDKLVGGGKVDVALEKQMWGDTFGMLTDKYGTDWMVNITDN